MPGGGLGSRTGREKRIAPTAPSFPGGRGCVRGTGTCAMTPFGDRAGRVAPVATRPDARVAIAAAASLGADGHALAAVLDDAAATLADDRWWLRLAITYPAIVAALALFGLAWITRTDGRLIRTIEATFHDPPSAAPVSPWPTFGPVDMAIAVAGMLAITALVAWLARLCRRDPDHAAAAVRCDLLAELTSCDCPGAERHRLADELLAGVGLTGPSAARPLAALAEGEADVDARASHLRAVAMFERGLDHRRRRRVRRLVPVIGCLVAGVAVLLYGVALFRPMARLFDTIARPQAMVPRGGDS